MQVVVSADDLGLTRGITEQIFRASDEGCLTSVSVIANGDALQEAVDGWLARPGLDLTAHLNLVEGEPLAATADVPLLVDARGRLSLSFGRLLLDSMRLRGAERERLRAQIRTEIDLQIGAVAAAAGPDWSPRVDGHRHYHMIPIVLEALLELHDKWRFSYVRVTEEPFFVTPELRRALPNYLGPNVLKHLLLRALSRRARARLDALGIAHPRWFVGLLFSGNMTVEPVRAALAHLRAWERRRGEDATVEFLLHPGRAEAAEAGRWKGQEELGEYYLSPWRSRERETLCSPEFRALVAKHLPAAAGGPSS